MWKTFTISDNTYMLKVSEVDGKFSIYLSDLKDIWFDDYPKEKIVQIFQERNPTIEVKPNKAVEEVLDIFNRINDAEVTITVSEDKINIYIKSDVLGLDVKLKIKYELDLTKADRKKFTEEITAPMMRTIHCLEKQQKMLCDVIQKKDRELEEYKMEKGDISRTDLITEKFDPTIIVKPSDQLLLNVYDETSKFWDTFASQYGKIETKIAEVTVDPWNHAKRKRKVYNAETAAKKASKGVIKY